MSSVEITTEVLAKSIDKTKEIVQNRNTGDTIKVKGLPGNYQLINKVASDDDKQLSAMAIAPIVNGQPDYNNVAVVYAGTTTLTETGKTGWWTAGGTVAGDLSGEYDEAKAFFEETQKKVANNNGKITDVAGFSQSGGYMMKMAAEYGSKYGFSTTSFDDFGKDQFNTLTRDEQEWLKKNPEMLTRYQNSSWAGLSMRDSTYGNVIKVKTDFLTHGTLSKYFDGNMLNLDRLAGDGILAPNMTKEQVERAVKNLVKNSTIPTPLSVDSPEASQLIKTLMEGYLNLYGAYAPEEFSTQTTNLSKLRAKLSESGGGLSANEELYLDSEEARIYVEKAAADFQTATEAIVKVYQEGIDEAEELWQSALSEARSKGSLLEDWEIRDVLDMMNCTEKTIATEPSEKYQEKIDKINKMSENFTNLIAEIKAKIDEVVQQDSDLAQQIAGA